MSFINKFKKINNKIKILYYLKKYEIINFELIEDHEYGYVVNVNGDVNLFNKHLKNIPFQFNIVKGDFICKYNFLKTLKCCPKVVHGKFDCSDNELKSLEYCPKIVNGDFYCQNNDLRIEGLKYLPTKIDSNNLYIGYNKCLNDLQDIQNFNKLREILNIKHEKENLLNIMNKENINKNTIINKI